LGFILLHNTMHPKDIYEPVD